MALRRLPCVGDDTEAGASGDWDGLEVHYVDASADDADASDLSVEGWASGPAAEEALGGLEGAVIEGLARVLRVEGMVEEPVPSQWMVCLLTMERRWHSECTAVAWSTREGPAGCLQAWTEEACEDGHGGPNLVR